MSLDNLIVALATPFNDNDTIDEQALVKLLQFQNNSSTNALVVCGSTGESSLLEDNEREKIIRLSLEHFKKPIIVGCGSPCTNKVLEQAMQAQKLGAHALLLITPYYSKPSQESLIEHFTYLHNHTDLEIILYNNPSRCMVDIELQTVERLFNFKRIIGLKDSTSDVTRTTHLKQKFKDKKIFCGDDILLPAFMAHGADGLISVIGNALPDLINSAITSYKKNSLYEFNSIYSSIFPLLQALLLKANPITIKALLNIQGFCSANMRMPLLPADANTIDVLKKALNQLNVTINALDKAI